MRKLFLALMLITGLALTLTACGTSSAAATTPTDTPAPAPTATTAPTAPAATATSASSGGSSSATITMGGESFVSTSATIKVGQSVTFDDPADTGGFHNIVTGSSGQFSAEPGAPAAFTSSGIQFANGTTMSFKFTTAGTYHFTCTIHPSMNATVTVTA